MKCFWCGGQLGNQKVCPKCGQDVTIYQKIIHASNSCYNLALELAKIRNLSAAIPYLQQSLKWNKFNMDARNLLGLIYYEIGEAGSALEEWTISASLRKIDNPAVRYLDLLAARQSRVENVNQVIHKYNQAIGYANDGSDDLAILQARQVISRNPKHLKAHLLLALLYIKKTEYGKAERVLRKALKIDAGNSTALGYMSELRDIAGRKKLKLGKKIPEVKVPEIVDDEQAQGDDILIPSYHERTGSWHTVVLLVMGVLIGGICTYFLIFPTQKRELQAEANRVQQEYFTTLNQLQDEIDRLQGGRYDRDEELQALLDQLEAYEEQEKLQEAALTKYSQLLQVYAYKAAGDDFHAMETLINISPDGEVSEEFLQSYQELMAEYSAAGVDQLYNYGVSQYNQAQYETARDYLLLAVRWREDFPEAVFWLGLSYWNLNEKTVATEYLNRLITQYPSHALVPEAKRLLGIS